MATHNLEYTSEPWIVGECGGIYPVASNGAAIVIGHSKSGFLPNHMENERRIVACVNACTGWPTLTLEILAVLGETLKSKTDELVLRSHKLEQQHNELLAAAKNLRDVKGRHHSEIAMNRLIEAITKAEQS